MNKEEFIANIIEGLIINLIADKYDNSPGNEYLLKLEILENGNRNLRIYSKKDYVKS